MKIWVDDVRPAPDGYVWCKSVNETIYFIQDYNSTTDLILDSFDFPSFESWCREIELIDLDHDAGDYAYDGGDYIRILDWLEEQGLSYPIHIHSMNPVGVQNMRNIIQRNGWKEI